MKRRWVVVAQGEEFNFRQEVRQFVLRINAERYAKQMSEIRGFVPLKFTVERR